MPVSILMSIFLGFLVNLSLVESLPKAVNKPALAKLSSSLPSADGRQPESPAHGQVTGTYGSMSRNGGVTPRGLAFSPTGVRGKENG